MPPFQRLTAAEQYVIWEALHALAFGGFIGDWEVPMRCNVDLAQYQEIANRWPDLDDSNRSDDYYAINGALAECCHSYEVEELSWEDWFTVTREQLLFVYRRWEDLHAADT